MRIVSLAPGATEILCAIGLGGEIVGIADDPSAGDLVDLATTPFVAHATWVAPGRRRLRVDTAALADAAPDLVVAERRDDVPADAVPGATVLPLAPTSLEGVFNAISAVGAMTSAEDAALELVGDLRDELREVEARVGERADEGHRPLRVVALEWLDPPHASGLWVPEQVRRAGGWDLLGAEGGVPRETSWASLADLDPDAILVMPRGADLRAAARLWDATPRPDGWEDLAAVRGGRVIGLDARSYFSVPGIRLVEGIALLAEILDPGAFAELAPEGGLLPLG